MVALTSTAPAVDPPRLPPAAVHAERIAGDQLAVINAWYAEQFLYLIQKLESVPEGDGTLLDSTAVLWASECGDPWTHLRGRGLLPGRPPRRAPRVASFDPNIRNPRAGGAGTFEMTPEGACVVSCGSGGGGFGGHGGDGGCSIDGDGGPGGGANGSEDLSPLRAGARGGGLDLAGQDGVFNHGGHAGSRRPAGRSTSSASTVATSSI